MKRIPDNKIVEEYKERKRKRRVRNIMKKILFVLLCFLLLSGTSHSQLHHCITGSQAAAGGAVAYCTGAATCTATTPGQCDVLCEDFEGAADCGDDTANDQTCRNTWDTTESVVNGNVVIFDATPTNALCTDEGSYAAQITKAYTTTSSCNFKMAFTEKANVWIQFYINITTQPATTGIAKIFALMDATTRVVTIDLGGDDYDWIRIVYDNGVDTTNGTTFTIAKNTWYRIRIVWNAATGGGNNGIVKFYVDDTLETDITNNNSFLVPDSIVFGNNANDPDIYTIQVDNIAVDDDTAQGACN